MGGKKRGTQTESVVPIPENLQIPLKEILAATDRFCGEHLDEEFKELCRDMAAVLVLEGFPLDKGKAAGWAAGIIYTVGWVNFLGDPTQPHHMRAEDMARAIGVSMATLMNRARDIRVGLGPERMDPRWATSRVLRMHPLLGM